MSASLSSPIIGHLYLVQEREFIRSGEQTYKVGKSRNVGQRMVQYPKDSRIVCFMGVSDIDVAEREILQIFRVMFRHETQYGAEYFSGSCREMMQQLLIVCQRYMDYTSVDATEAPTIDAKEWFVQWFERTFEVTHRVADIVSIKDIHPLLLTDEAFCRLPTLVQNRLTATELGKIIRTEPQFEILFRDSRKVGSATMYSVLCGVRMAGTQRLTTANLESITTPPAAITLDMIPAAPPGYIPPSVPPGYTMPSGCTVPTGYVTPSAPPASAAAPKAPAAKAKKPSKSVKSYGPDLGPHGLSHEIERELAYHFLKTSNANIFMAHREIGVMELWNMYRAYCEMHQKDTGNITGHRSLSIWLTPVNWPKGSHGYRFGTQLAIPARPA